MKSKRGLKMLLIGLMSVKLGASHHPTFINSLPSSPRPFSQKERRGAGFKVPLSLGEGFRERANETGMLPVRGCIPLSQI